MKYLRLLVPFTLAGGIAFAATACETEDPTSVVVDNDYSAVPDGGDSSTELTVYKAWWVASYMPDAVAPGAEGLTQRTVFNTDFAYAVLAVGWDPSSTDPPTKLIAMKSYTKVRIGRGEILHLRVSDRSFGGNCAAGHPLSQDDADFVTTRIFPAEFTGGAYDAATCTFTLATTDGGVEAGVDLDAGIEGGHVDDGGNDN